MPQFAGDADSGVELAEVVAAMSLAVDLATGQPLDHVLRSCAIATRFAEHLRLPSEDRETTYWVTLFMVSGCTGTSSELSFWFGDDIAFRADAFEVGPSNLDMLRYLVSRAGRGRNIVGRARIVVELLATKMQALEASFVAHCTVSQRLAQRLGLGEAVAASLRQTFARWDGKGLPPGVGGDDLLPPITIANLANQAAFHSRRGGVEEAIARVRETGGIYLPPALVDAWSSAAPEVLAGVDEVSSWDQVIATRPHGRGRLTEGELDEALELLADFADLKSPCFAGHSRGVATLAVAAARHAGLPEVDLVSLRRAAWLHDIGRNGISNDIWDKPGPLSDGEMERVRLHAYYTDRVLHRVPKLAALASVASAAHERVSGAGYPRGTAGSALPLLGRFLEAADVYHAMIEDRPHRPAHPRDAAAAELRRAARAGEMDGAAVDAVLAAAGHAPRRKPTAPAGLTPREIEVLVLASRGGTTKAVGHKLGISPKTASNHLERIYAKIGVSSRAEAAMFAMQNGLIPAWDTAEP